MTSFWTRQNHEARKHLSGSQELRVRSGLLQRGMRELELMAKFGVLIVVVVT